MLLSHCNVALKWSFLSLSILLQLKYQYCEVKRILRWGAFVAWALGIRMWGIMMKIWALDLFILQVHFSNIYTVFFLFFYSYLVSNEWFDNWYAVGGKRKANVNGSGKMMMMISSTISFFSLIGNNFFFSYPRHRHWYYFLSFSAASGKKGCFLRAKGRENNSQKGNAARSFTFRELAMATQNFRDPNLIDEGDFGSVYRGRLESGLVSFLLQDELCFSTIWKTWIFIGMKGGCLACISNLALTINHLLVLSIRLLLWSNLTSKAFKGIKNSLWRFLC